MIVPPVGLGCIAEILYTNDIEFEIIDFSLGYNVGYLVNTIERYKPKTAAISILTFRYKHLYTIFERIKHS